MPIELGFHRTTFFTRTRELQQARTQFISGLEKFAKGDAVRHLGLAATPVEFKEMLGNLIAELGIETTRFVLQRYDQATDYPPLDVQDSGKNNIFTSPSDKAPCEYKFAILTIIMLGQEKDSPFYALDVEGQDPFCIINLLKPLFTDALTAAVKNWEATKA